MNDIDVAKAFDYIEKYIALSKNDAFALTLAKVKKCNLLTSDKSLRNAATKEGVKVHGIFWLIDQLVSYQLIDDERMLALFQTMG